MNFSALKKFAVGLAATALSLAVLFFFIRRAPGNVRAFFQA